MRVVTFFTGASCGVPPCRSGRFLRAGVDLGRPSDGPEFPARLDELLALPWGRRAVRIAIAIGRDADEEILRSFIGVGAGSRPLQANSPEDLADLIRWTATVVLREVSQPAVEQGTTAGARR